MTKRRAWLRLRSSAAYRRDAFTQGLERVGFKVITEDKEIRDGDVLIIWNRYRQHHDWATRFEKRGQTVLVVENAYISPPWGKKWFAMAIDHHLGAGWWPNLGPQRWDTFEIDLKPFRAGGEEILILPQRGIGEPGVAMPGSWLRPTEKKLRKIYGDRVRVRYHPGGRRNPPPLERDFENAYCAVTWASGAAIKALAAGVPVFYYLPKWIGAGAARYQCRNMDKPMRDEARRQEMFERLAWSQWNINEVINGEAFEWFLR